MNHNPSPKTVFCADSEAVKVHRTMVQTDHFNRAIDVALLEYQRVVATTPGDVNAGAAKYFSLLGAQQFVELLRNLAEEPSRVATIDRMNLNSNR